MNNPGWRRISSADCTPWGENRAMRTGVPPDWRTAGENARELPRIFFV
jgi:hypothetical protein